MNNGNLDTEKYKQELMKLYSRSAPRSGENGGAENGLTAAETEKLPDDTAYAEFAETDTNGGTEDFNSRYPEPDLSGLDTDTGSSGNVDDEPPVYEGDELLGSERGYILINVRTGDDSSAVAGASVKVTAVADGRRLVLASGVTDESGVSPRFSLPVPDLEHSQSPDPAERPYNLFDISVDAEGFFRARSVDVPVFPGITSVQNFNLIPVPLMMNSGDETVTYYNAEPGYGSGKE